MKESPMQLAAAVAKGDTKALARAITVVENSLNGYEEILLSLPAAKHIPIIGITGPPGAGKSTLVNNLIKNLLGTNEKESRGIAVLAVDPSSTAHGGAMLGDRLRMKEHFNREKVFIRSVATRGALGGLSAKTIEITELLKITGFDYILVETVGVGQSETEIASLADITLLVLTPESGDDIQVMKSGVMEIADIFVVNKADRDGADAFVKNLKQLMPLTREKEKIKVVKTVATQDEGTNELTELILKSLKKSDYNAEAALLAERAYRLILSRKMRDIDKKRLQKEIEAALKKDSGFSIFRFAENY